MFLFVAIKLLQFIKCVIQVLSMVLWPLMLNSAGNRLNCKYSCLKHGCSLGLQASREESDRISPACLTFSRGRDVASLTRPYIHLSISPQQNKKQSQENQAGANLVSIFISVGSTALLDNRVLLKDTASFSIMDSSRQTNQQIWNMFPDDHDSWSGCLQQKSCCSHWERADREASSPGCCTSTCLSAGIPLMFFISSLVFYGGKTQGKPTSAIFLFALKLHLPKCLWDLVSGIASVDLFLQKQVLDLSGRIVCECALKNQFPHFWHH